jgi:hypothetical protein
VDLGAFRSCEATGVESSCRLPLELPKRHGRN